MPDPPFRFAFNEVVRIVTDDPELAEVTGERGVVVGRTEGGLAPGYGVFVYREQKVWCVEEVSLEATGEFDRREAPTLSIRVLVDEKGRGHVAGARELRPGTS